MEGYIHKQLTKILKNLYTYGEKKKIPSPANNELWLFHLKAIPDATNKKRTAKAPARESSPKPFSEMAMKDTQ